MLNVNGVDVPTDVEHEGADAIAAYVAAHQAEAKPMRTLSPACRAQRDRLLAMQKAARERKPLTKEQRQVLDARIEVAVMGDEASADAKALVEIHDAAKSSAAAAMLVTEAEAASIETAAGDSAPARRVRRASGAQTGGTD